MRTTNLKSLQKLKYPPKIKILDIESNYQLSEEIKYIRSSNDSYQ